MLLNAVGNGAAAFQNITKYDIEDHCVDFDKLSKRKGALKDHFDFCNTNYAAVIKYVSVRWLFLKRCIE